MPMKYILFKTLSQAGFKLQLLLTRLTRGFKPSLDAHFITSKLLCSYSESHISIILQCLIKHK